MFKHIERISIVAAAVALAACNPEPAEPAANDAAIANDVAAVNSAIANDLAPATGAVCGGIGGQKCAGSDEFCKKAFDKCEAVDDQGSCTTKPEMCPQYEDPVCGCDGKVYGNACKADAAGVSIQPMAKCKPKG